MDIKASPGPGEVGKESHERPVGDQEDAPRSEVAIYAAGNVESAIADQFPNVLQNILIVAAQVNPLLLGLIMGVKTMWDAVTDPVMAHITDNTRGKYGRRRPYILGGGVSRVLFLIVFVAFLPKGNLAQNSVMEAQREVNEGIQSAGEAHLLAVNAWREIKSADAAGKERILKLVETARKSGAGLQLIAKKEPPGHIPLMERALAQIRESLPALEEDLRRRQRDAELKKAGLDALNQNPPARNSEEAGRIEVARGLFEAAEKRRATAAELIGKARRGQSEAIAALAVFRHVLASAGRIKDSAHLTKEAAEAAAEGRMSDLGLPLIPVFEVEPPPPPKPGAAKSPLSGIKEGFEAFFDPHNYDQRALILYVLVGILIFTTLTTVTSVPYYALGIELSPSYNGRTQVVVYRSVVNQFAGILGPWVPVFCFSLLFSTAFEGLLWVAVCASVIGIPTTLLLFFKTRERTRATVKKKGERPNMLKAMFQIARAPDFLRILFLYVFIGLVNGLFAQIGFFLNVYWVAGSALSGSILGAQVSMIAWVLGLFILPVINWACKKFQKHRVLQFAIVWMAIGTALKWWAMNPEHPEFQFILPFFFSIGIGSVYTILPTMMADVTDLDELRYGVRREGMFGAVMAFLMKGISTVIPIAAGAVLVLCGFNPALEYRQEAPTILNMRILYSLVPAVMLLGALVALHKYPLTRERVLAIKEQLRQRHSSEAGH